ncbi:MAG: EAL domain-containing protein [Gammaproteobacteria bacterium]|nr:EAL domain-containing protein [Gammaproteobacteria bacterium]
MTIRSKLLLLFAITTTILAVIGLYAASVYRSTLSSERTIAERTNLSVEIAHQAESHFHAQINAWKNVLLRGNETNNYHRYLQKFYQAERNTRSALSALQEQIDGVPEAIELTAKLSASHREMGRTLREGIRVFNATESNPGQVTDRLVAGAEDLPTQLLNNIIRKLQKNRSDQLTMLTEQRVTQERNLLILIALVLIISVLIFIWLLDRSIVQPAEKASHLADIIDNAQRVARFGTWDWESENDKHFWSDGLYDILGVDAGHPPSTKLFLSRLLPDDRDRVRQTIEHAQEKISPFEFEARIHHKDDQERVVQLRGQVTEVNTSGQRRMTCIVYDITERKESEKRLARLANFDLVTELPNRNLFQDRLKHAMAQADRKKGQLALLYLDLDHFKAVNDALGHLAGDELLIEAARRIRSNIREGDTAARLGGDEFTIIIEQFDYNAQVVVVAEHILFALNKSYQIGTHEIYVSASMGITIYPNDGRDVEALLKNADSAMYLAKEQGRNTYHFYTEELNRKAHERLHLENSLRMALEREEFQLHYQPQVDLKTGRILGAEVLLRWSSGQDAISPVRFIPILEETGMIVAVGRWVLDQACLMAKSWQQRGFKDFHVSVNLSVRQLRLVDLVEEIQEILLRTELAPEFLEIELTESTLIDTSIGMQNLKHLEQLGVRLAIDDFGTGYSSLSYLKEHDVDILKIDRSFIKDINRDSDDDAVTSAIVALAHKLDMRVIAEGVESLEQLEFLKKQNCDQAQGFLISRPLKSHQLEQWMMQYLDQSTGQACWYPDTDIPIRPVLA